MATIVDEAFESGLSGYFTSGTAPTTGAAAAHTGSNGLIVTTAGGVASQIYRSLPASTRAHTFRFYFRFTQDTSGSASIYQADCGAGTFVVQARAGRKLRLYVGGTTGAESSALTLDQWYLIDGLFVSSGATATADLRIDTLPLTQVTHVQNAGDQTYVRVGNTGTNTYIIHVDDWKLTDQSADYPLGALPSNSAAAQNAAGTGAVAAASRKIYASAGHAAGTGQTWVGITGELVVASQLVTGEAFITGTDPATESTPTPSLASGTGAAQSTGRSVSLNGLSTGSGSGEAYGISPIMQATAEIASGLGAASGSVISTVLNVSGELASGTGASANAAPLAQSAAEPGLTIQMGMG